MENFSPEYIRMAVAADEIHLFHPESSFQKGDWILPLSRSRDALPIDLFEPLMELRGTEDMHNWNNPKWIPRLDQLKAMLNQPLPRPWESQGVEIRKVYYDADTYYGHEEVLKMVMENHSLVWNGEAWVPA